jgi:hypothetical protein
MINAPMEDFGLLEWVQDWHLDYDVLVLGCVLFAAIGVLRYMTRRSVRQ